MSQGRVTYRFSYAMRHNDANKMTPAPCHMRHSHHFDKIDSFLNFVLDIFILCNLTVGWREWVVKEGVFCIKSRDLGEVLIAGGSRIHQSRSCYYLEPFKISKVQLFAKIVFGYKLLTFIVKNSNFHVSLFP